MWIRDNFSAREVLQKKGRNGLKKITKINWYSKVLWVWISIVVCSFLLLEYMAKLLAEILKLRGKIGNIYTKQTNYAKFFIALKNYF